MKVPEYSNWTQELRVENKNSLELCKRGLGYKRMEFTQIHERMIL